MGRYPDGQDGAGAAPRISLETVGQPDDGGARRLRHLPRFVLEPRRAGLMAEPALLCRVRRICVFLRHQLLPVCDLRLRYDVWTNPLSCDYAIAGFPALHVAARP